jgi:hypothetical protein
MFAKCFTKVAQNGLRQVQYITEPRDAKNSWYDNKFDISRTVVSATSIERQSSAHLPTPFQKTVPF